MKTKFINIIASVFLAATFVSCELDTAPTDAVVDSEVFRTTAGNEKVLNGTWGYLMETFSTYANPGYGSFLRTNDAMGSDVVLNNNYGFRTHYALNALYSKGSTNTHSWNLTYKTINGANNVIARVYEAEGTVVDKQRIFAQALALRGFMYLHLASSYSFAINVDPEAKTAPIYLEPTGKNSSPKGLSSVSELYKQSILDLEEALSLMPETYVRNAKYKIDREVILGLLSRATLYSRDWQKAKLYSDMLLANDAYLMSEAEYKSGFNDASNGEWIWGHPQTPEQNNASYQFNYLDVTSPESYYFSFNADPYFKELFDDNDYRKSMIYWAPNPASTKPRNDEIAYMRYAKFKFKTGQIADIVLMRTSEIYLINAEAKAQLGEGSALQVLNDLKRARGANEVAGLSGQALLDEIWIERRKELFGEGFALTDIIRNQQKIERKEYPQSTKVPFAYEVMNSSGQIETITVNLLPQGHHILNFPDKSAFGANSKYYLYRIPDVEYTNNPYL